ncbi:MAG: zinc ribbon domain-containing protein [Chloroflexi bacterium]|nr:zinc ribbon domain-containing protein [Chloroflexota bacterium]
MPKPGESFCQSCGMPLSQDERGGGTEADGHKSAEYCSHCYLNGRFTDPGLSVDGMIALVKGKLQEMQVPGAVASELAKQIPNLRRWKR